MTTDELLVECFGRADFPKPMHTVEMVDERTGDVLSHLDVYQRNVRVRLPRTPGNAVEDAATTLRVPSIAQVCTAPEHRGKGYASALVRRAHAELLEHRPASFVTLCGPLAFYGPLGYFHPAGASREDFLVYRLRDEPWPEGSVRLMGEW